jgi:cytochrome bd-type quinol oxidase subunit 2
MRAVVCEAGLLAGYAMLGATWLIFKTDGTTAHYGRVAARITLPLTLALIARQHLNAARLSSDRAALVQLAQHRISF